jgi:cytidylate kinase
MMDPLGFDLVINTKHFNIEAAVSVVREAFNARQWYDYSMRG